MVSEILAKVILIKACFMYINRWFSAIVVSTTKCHFSFPRVYLSKGLLLNCNLYHDQYSNNLNLPNCDPHFSILK